MAEQLADDVIVSVRDLVKTFPGPEGKPVRVLDKVTFDLHVGEILVVMGGSGCGKSTLLNCMIGEYDYDEGTITYRTRNMPDPINLRDMSEEQLNELRKNFGILFQSGALFNSMSVGDNIALPLREHSYVDPSIIDIVVALKLQQVHMLEHRDKMPAQLSGGQKKRAGLARATSLDPEILYYDEPSAGLDPITSAAIDQLIIDLTKKLRVSSLVVTHEMDSAFRIADRMIMLDQGRVLKVGTRSEFSDIRDTPAEQLPGDDERLIRQFLRGEPEGPLTNTEAVSDYERFIFEV